MDISYAARKLSSAIDYLDQTDGSQHDRLVLAFYAIEAVDDRCFDSDEQLGLWKAIEATATRAGQIEQTLAQLADHELVELESLLRKLDALSQVAYRKWMDKKFRPQA